MNWTQVSYLYDGSLAGFLTCVFEAYTHREEPADFTPFDQACASFYAQRSGDFTNSGHFIVIYDYSRKKFSVNDPFSYTNSSKKWEYTTLISQCQQIWVYAA